MSDSKSKAEELEVVAEEVKPKKVKKSTSYAVKAFSGHLDTLREGGVISDEEHQKVSKIMAGPIKKWVQEQFGI